MKTTLILLTAILLSQNSYSQVQTESETPASNAKSIENARTVERTTRTTETRKNASFTISKRAGENQVTHDQAYYDAEIAKIDAHVLAIDEKIAYVNADSQRKADAQANGWFDDMDRIKEELATKRASLVEKRNNL